MAIVTRYPHIKNAFLMGLVLAIIALIAYQAIPLPWSNKVSPKAVKTSLNERSASGRISPTVSEVKCLAATLYYEAGNQGTHGQTLVGHVVINRMRAFSKTACEIVKQKRQFQWYTVHKRIPNVREEFEQLAHELLMQHHTRTYKDKTKGSLFFVTKTIYPELSWVKPVRVAYGEHVFF